MCVLVSIAVPAPQGGSRAPVLRSSWFHRAGQGEGLGNKTDFF